MIDRHDRRRRRWAIALVAPFLVIVAFVLAVAFGLEAREHRVLFIGMGVFVMLYVTMIVVLGIVSITRRARHDIQLSQRKCPICGSNITATPEYCPECGSYVHYEPDNV